MCVQIAPGPPMDELCDIVDSIIHEQGYSSICYPNYLSSFRIAVRSQSSDLPFAMIQMLDKTIVVYAIVRDDGGERFDERLVVDIYDPNSFDKMKACIREREQCSSFSTRTHSKIKAV